LPVFTSKCAKCPEAVAPRSSGRRHFACGGFGRLWSHARSPKQDWWSR
jgi:hypothetical protein